MMMIKIMVWLGVTKKLQKKKTKPKEEEASGTIRKNTEDSTPPGLDVQHDNKPKKVQCKIIIDDMPESGSAGHIDILPDAIQKDENDVDISGDMINVEDDDEDMEIPCSQIVCQSPYARMKYVEPNNNDVEHNQNTEDGQKNIVEKKDLEQVTDNICKKEESKKLTLQVTMFSQVQ